MSFTSGGVVTIATTKIVKGPQPSPYVFCHEQGSVVTLSRESEVDLPHCASPLLTSALLRARSGQKLKPGQMTKVKECLVLWKCYPHVITSDFVLFVKN